MNQIVCDICGAVIKDKESPNGTHSGARYSRFRYGLIGVGKTVSIDICDCCVEKIRELSRLERGEGA